MTHTKQSLTTLIEGLLPLWQNSHFCKEKEKEMEYERRIHELCVEYRKVTGEYYFHSQDKDKKE